MDDWRFLAKKRPCPFRNQKFVSLPLKGCFLVIFGVDGVFLQEMSWFPFWKGSTSVMSFGWHPLVAPSLWVLLTFSCAIHLPWRYHRRFSEWKYEHPLSPTDHSPPELLRDQWPAWVVGDRISEYLHIFFRHFNWIRAISVYLHVIHVWHCPDEEFHCPTPWQVVIPLLRSGITLFRTWRTCRYWISKTEYLTKFWNVSSIV